MLQVYFHTSSRGTNVFQLNVKPVYAVLQGLFVEFLESYIYYLLCGSYLLNTAFLSYAFPSDSVCLETSFTLYILPSVEWV